MTVSWTRIRTILNETTYAEFQAFMRGQTVEMGKNGKAEVFEDDFLKFVKRLPCTD